MAHFMIDYSANLDEVVDWPAFCDLIRRTAIDTGVFPMAGIRVRAFRATHVSIADGDPKHDYIDISVRLRGGRTLEARKSATADLFAAAEDFLKPLMQTRSIALSMEMRDIDPELAPKTGTIRDHLKG
ncbi:5-carboxymethyl-2-hydroxymuconate Delta-isomerase [Thalassovita aquimarina]|uniref:5-carboxymethyl-2-hydroxymuconate isomerase n=1 Tax=Thalassovita aquimarina TaxID=2785917 RepID=A0ABS5HPA7_9RHOB|nr:5-carboxymethyl-2-hydroxymuconate Delta-isomerase [Thalassovita aquimarina]MBR9650784.1 5-carboxymethyl-2-hydroxymuconate isomerase [Thalassovita aquimarina]